MWHHLKKIIINSFNPVFFFLESVNQGILHVERVWRQCFFEMTHQAHQDNLSPHAVLLIEDTGVVGATAVQMVERDRPITEGLAVVQIPLQPNYTKTNIITTMFVASVTLITLPVSPLQRWGSRQPSRPVEVLSQRAARSQ